LLEAARERTRWVGAKSALGSLREKKEPYWNVKDQTNGPTGRTEVSRSSACETEE
jgi:hypothetical protein